MRIVLIGTVVFSREMLLQLIGMDAQVEGVCTAATTALNSDYADMEPICREHGIPMYRTDSINASETLEWMRERRPDVIFCFGWSRLIGPAILDLPRLGVIGYHPTKLPANRGRHPLIWALALGLERTASSFFLMDEGADSGDILSQQEIEILPEDDASTLYRKVIATARRQLLGLVPALANECVQRRKQDARHANYWRKRSAADGRIDWRMPARSIHNLVRALVRPYPGAEIVTVNGPVTVWKTELVYDVPPNAEPGKVLFHLDGRPVIRCGELAICLVETEPDFAPAPGAYL